MHSNSQIAVHIINQIKIINHWVLSRIVAHLKMILTQKIPKTLGITLSWVIRFIRNRPHHSIMLICRAPIRSNWAISRHLKLHLSMASTNNTTQSSATCTWAKVSAHQGHLTSKAAPPTNLILTTVRKCWLLEGLLRKMVFNTVWAAAMVWTLLDRTPRKMEQARQWDRTSVCIATVRR